MITVHISDVFATTTGTSLQQVNPFLPWHDVLNTDYCLPFSPFMFAIERKPEISNLHTNYT